jgi:ectoine hydroxylase-related dioxygenase (phytanoyl-CoA dioxygenase family)
MPTTSIPAAPLTPHELNHDFEWRDHVGPFRVLTDEQAAQYDRGGFTVVRGAFSAEELGPVTAAIDALEAHLEAVLREHNGGTHFIYRADEITFTTHLVKQSQVVRDFVVHPVLLDLAADICGPDVRFYWDQSVYKKPGTTSPFPWHQDNGYAFLSPQPYLTCWIALTDATTANGCPWVVPGLHRGGTFHHELTDLGLVCFRDAAETGVEPVPVEVAAGDIVVLSTLTPHCTGPNDTDQVRKSYIAQYAPEGGAVIRREDDGSLSRTPADDPIRQFPILAGGRPVPVAPLTSE